jgi:multidrug efflux pump subunit AcrA (membrane-fusion protein)
MKALKIVTTISIICLLVFLSISCSSNSTSTSAATTRTVTVLKGNLSSSITGTGNLAYSSSEKLAFEMAGYVEDVSVSQGDTVKEGQDLVKLDTSDWESQIKTLQKALESANRNVETADRTLTARQTALTKAQRAVTDAQLTVTKSQLDLRASQNSLEQISDVKTAQTAVDNAQYTLDMAKSNQQAANGTGDVVGAEYYKTLIPDLTNALNQAIKDRDAILNGIKETTSRTIALQIAQAQLDLQQKQRAIETAQLAVEDARTAVTNAQIDVTNAQADLSDAELNVKDAQSSLDDAKNLSPVITAPYDGFITKVNVQGGDEVQKGTVAVQIVDPEKFEANILITENDVFSIEVGQAATVSLDALSGISFPATITAIAPTATALQGVVNYAVTVELTSIQPSNTSKQLTSGASAASNTSATSTKTDTITLKDGLSATVKIVTEQASNVLILPSKAITHQGQNYTVQVVKGTATETRTVKTGMTDGSNTEITEGLSEGEQIVYKVSSSSSSSTTSSSTQQSIQSLGGAGGPPPGGF